MNKITQYLNEHILGEVTTDANVRKALSTDASVLTITPEIVAYPRITNDIRKIARFSWQLADKGHTLPITPRGSGTDQTGAAIGKGLVIDTTAHMNTIFELDAKQKLIRLQPGVNYKTLNDTLALHGLQIPAYPASYAYSTIGGAIANNSSGILSGKYGATGSWVHQLEVVLANGDVLQTGRISKRDLNRKKGLQTFEGEIYRQLDNLIADNSGVLDKLDGDIRDNVGYNGIVDVKRRDGSFDLAPLLFGSQGTLGIISEVIMKADFFSRHQLVALAVCESYDHARDALDDIVPHDPSILEVIDGHLFKEAKRRGKKYAFQADIADEKLGAVVLFALDDLSERVQKKKLKKIQKALRKKDLSLTVAIDEQSRLELLAVRDVSYVATHPDGDKESAPPLFDGAHVPLARFEDFSKAVHKLATKYDTDMPIYGHALGGIFYARPVIEMHKVTERQKIFKLLSDYSTIVAAHNGHLIGEAAEGRLKASFAYKQLDDDIVKLYEDIKKLFDPTGIMNPGVKQAGELKAVVSSLRTEYDMSKFAGHAPTN
jgi:FAD/FMN-containing dehydrogenase